jgi:hypothetical protein
MIVFSLLEVLVLLASLVLVVWRRVVAPLLLLTIRPLLDVLSKPLPVQLLVVSVLWNSYSPVSSCRLVSKSTTTGCAPQTSARTTSVDEGTTEQRRACD